MLPLAPSLKEVSDQDLYKKYNELLAKMNQAFRSGPRGLVPQIQMMMEHYQTEIQERTAKQQEEMAARAAKGKTKDGKGYTGVIDIR
jgi:hypothetical protein